MPYRHDLLIEGHTIVALEYNAYKGGTPAILIHGIMSSVGFWPESGHPFDDHHWYSLSLPGHYPAVLPDGFRDADLSAESIARVLAEAIRQLTGEQRVILLGHSTGAFAALAIAAQAPELVQSVISVSGFAQGKWGGLLRPLQQLAAMGGMGEAMFRMNVKSGVLHPLVVYHLSSLYAADKQAYFADPHFYKSLRTQFAYTQRLNTRAMAHYFKRMPQIDITDWLPRISAPTLVITGDSDPIVSPMQSVHIAEKVQDGGLVMLARAGHMVMLERAAEYKQVIDNWLQEDAAPILMHS